MYISDVLHFFFIALAIISFRCRSFDYLGSFVGHDCLDPDAFQFQCSRRCDQDRLVGALDCTDLYDFLRIKRKINMLNEPHKIYLGKISLNLKYQIKFVRLTLFIHFLRFGAFCFVLKSVAFGFLKSSDGQRYSRFPFYIVTNFSLINQISEYDEKKIEDGEIRSGLNHHDAINTNEISVCGIHNMD